MKCKECGNEIRLERCSIPCQDSPNSEQYVICIACYWLAMERNAICVTICPIRLAIDETIQLEIMGRVNVTIPDTRDNWTRENVQRAAKDSMQALTRGQVKNGGRARRNAAQEFTRIMDEPIRALIADTDEAALWNVRRMIQEWMPAAFEDDRASWHRLNRIMGWINLSLKYGAYRAPKPELTDGDILADATDDLINSAPASLIGRF